MLYNLGGFTFASSDVDYKMEILKNGDWRFEDAEELKSVVDAFISQNHSGVSVESAPNDAEFLYQIETVLINDVSKDFNDSTIQSMEDLNDYPIADTLIFNNVEGNEYDQSQLEMGLYWDGQLDAQSVLIETTSNKDLTSDINRDMPVGIVRTAFLNIYQTSDGEHVETLIVEVEKTERTSFDEVDESKEENKESSTSEGSDESEEVGNGDESATDGDENSDTSEEKSNDESDITDEETTDETEDKLEEDGQNDDDSETLENTTANENEMNDETYETIDTTEEENVSSEEDSNNMVLIIGVVIVLAGLAFYFIKKKQ